jgi:hypothetical protein
MFAVVGTVPQEDFPMVCGPATLSGNKLILENQTVAINRGTPALIAAAIKVCRFFNAPLPTAYLIGDIGKGAGSRKLYGFLEKTVSSQKFNSLTFHYIQPDVDWHNRVLFAVEDMPNHPVLIADAGFMYAAKMSGQAPAYDVFTPDIGELAFLADENAPHPFYTRGFIFQEEERVPEMIEKAYRHKNAARYLLVKGEKDLLATASGIMETISEPKVSSLEAIGGTGDIVTGLIAAFTGLGKETAAACVLASTISRLAGQAADPDPGTQVIEIIDCIPKVLECFFARNSF